LSGQAAVGSAGAGVDADGVGVGGVGEADGFCVLRRIDVDTCIRGECVDADTPGASNR
jgi:hypothetical protein